MNDKLKLIKGAFPEQMEIWLVTQYTTHLKEFEEVFHRRIRLIRNLDDLISIVDQSPKYEDGNVYASVIFYRAMPEDIKSEVSNVTDLLNVIERINVYEVERDDQFYEKSYQYGSLRVLEVEYKGLDRSQYIQDLPEDDKKKRVLQELDIELNRYKERLKEREESEVILNKRIKELERDIQDFSTQLDTEKNIHGKRVREDLKKVKRELEERKDNHDIDKKRVLDLRETKRYLEDKVDSLSYEKEALKNNIRRLEQELDMSKEDYELLEESYTELQRERAELMLQTSVGEKYDSLLRKSNKKEEELNNAIKEISRMRVLLNEESIRTHRLEESLDKQRRGHLAEEFHGRTVVLDKATLENTDLVYIKVVDNLPYHRSAIKSLFELIQERYNNRARMAIIRHDDGLDKYRFEGVNVYRSLEDVEYEDEYFRLSANTSMFTGVERFEREIDLLFVVDYTGGNDYVVDTNGLSNIMTMVRYPERLKDPRFGLKGMPLTIGSESVYNLRYNPAIDTLGVGSNKKLYIREGVKDWMARLKLRN